MYALSGDTWTTSSLAVAMLRERARGRAFTMNSPRAAVSRGEVVGGHYRLERVLAEGGMGIVWAARDLRLGRPVAIKFLGAEAMANPVQRERFAREAQLASKIRSPHVVQIIGDGVTDSGVPFVVMELLDGESLAGLLAREGRCSLATCGAIVEQVCRALSSAHSLGLVHRDIKPANIFLTPQPGGDLFVRLLDFGIAKELHFGPSGLTRSGELLGTTDYMSPEQFRKPEAVSTATDIWSLGVVVYEMLTGKLPFDESSFPSLAVRVAPGAFPPPSAVAPGLPPAIDHAVLGALAIHPSQRYASVDEFALAFLRVVRAHISKSVVRADLALVFEDDELTPLSTVQPQRLVDQPTMHVRGWSQARGTLLVGLCAVVLVGSWLVLERAERGLAGRDVHVGSLPVSAAESLPPPAAEPLPLAAAEELSPVAAAERNTSPVSAVASETAFALRAPEPPLDPLPSPDALPTVPEAVGTAADTPAAAPQQELAPPANVRPSPAAKAPDTPIRRKRSEPKTQEGMPVSAPPSPALPIPSPASEIESKYGF